MKTFKIKNGDLSIDQSGNLEMVEKEDEIAQSVEMILSANKGEWFLNDAFGLEYDEITSKGQAKRDIEFALREAIFQEERIQGIDFHKVEVDSEKRSLSVNLELTTEDNEIMRIGVNV